MASSGSATVTTTSLSKATAGIWFDPGYLKTIPGILKVAEGLLSLIGFICVQTIFMASFISAGGFYKFVSMTGFWIPLLFLILYVFHFVEKFHRLPWLVTEFGFAALWAAFFFIAACVAASNGRLDPGWGAAAFFGFVAMGTFGYEAFRKYKTWKAKKPAQGEQTATTSNTDDTSSPTGATGPNYSNY